MSEYSFGFVNTTQFVSFCDSHIHFLCRCFFYFFSLLLLFSVCYLTLWWIVNHYIKSNCEQVYAKKKTKKSFDFDGILTVLVVCNFFSSVCGLEFLPENVRIIKAIRIFFCLRYRLVCNEIPTHCHSSDLCALSVNASCSLSLCFRLGHHFDAEKKALFNIL